MKHRILSIFFVLGFLLTGLIVFLPANASAASSQLVIPQAYTTSSGGLTSDVMLSFNWVNEGTINATLSIPSDTSFTPYDLTFTDPSAIQDYYAGQGDSTSFRFLDDQTCTAGNVSENSTLNANAAYPNTKYGLILEYAKSINGQPFGSCSQTVLSTIPDSIQVPTNADIAMTLDGSTINRVDNNPGYSFSFVETIGTNDIYTKGGAPLGNCADEIVIDTTKGDSDNNATLWELVSGGSETNIPGAPGCSFSSDNASAGDINDAGGGGGESVRDNQNSDQSWPIHVDTTGASTVQTPGSSTTGSSLATQELSCSLSILNPLTWLVCPIVAAAGDAVGQLDSAINDLLNFDVGTYLNDTAVNGKGVAVDPTLPNGDTNPAPALYTAWSTFRTLALSLIAIAGLVMVFAQAIGSEAIDAYTVKKVLPRILVAALVISLSWQLMKILIQLTDDAGYGIRALIYAPFHSYSQIKINLSSSWAIGIIGGGALLGLDLIGLLSFTLTALVAVLVGFAMLVFRKIVLLFLIIISPIAIACFVLPNTQKVWKLWWSNFSKLLLMFPIIAGMIAVGRVFALIADGSQTGSLIDQITAIISYFGPYFLIPTAFKMAGGIGQLAGSVASKANSVARKPISTFRTNKLKKHAGELKKGTRYSGKGYLPGTQRVARRFGRITAGASMGPGKNFGLRVKGGQAFDQEERTRAAAILGDKEFQAKIANNEEALRALTYNTGAEAKDALILRYKLKDPKMTDKDAEDKAILAIRGAQASGLKFGDRGAQIAAAQQLVETGTGYENLEDQTETLARVSNGNESTGSALAGYANSRNKATGRWELAPGFGQLQKLVNTRVSGGVPTTAEYREADIAASRGVDPVTTVRQKPQAVENLTKSLQGHYQDTWKDYQASIAPRSGKTVKEQKDLLAEVVRTSGQMKQLDQAKSYGSVEVQNHVNKMYNDPTVRGIRKTIEPMITSSIPDIDPVTKQQKVDPATGRGKMLDPTDPDMADLWQQIAPRLQNNPNDPFNTP